MDSYKIQFLKALGEVTEQTGKRMTYKEVASVLNAVGIKNDKGEEYSGESEGIGHFLSCAASQCHETGDEDGTTLIRFIALNK